MTAQSLNIYQRILGVMKDIDYIEKGSAKVNGMYRFVSHDAVTAKLHPALVKHGIVVIPSVEELKQEGNRTMVKLRVVFCNVDNPTEGIVTFHYGYGIDGNEKGPGDKGIGKAVSYAFKYALLKTFCLETGDDPDNDANALYEPEKCLDFDSEVDALGWDKKEVKELNKFLAYSSGLMKKHVEDVKREALKKMPEFFKAFDKWKKKR